MTTEGLNGVKVGDSLILATNNRYRGNENATVSRIGRKYLYVSVNGYERRERFDRTTGVEDTNYGTAQRLYTQEQYEEQTLRTWLFQKLREAGIDFQHGVCPALTTDKLRALLSIMDGDAASLVTEK